MYRFVISGHDYGTRPQDLGDCGRYSLMIVVVVIGKAIVYMVAEVIAQ